MRADLTIMGKVIGGGLPAAALGGRAELMRMLAPAGEVYQAGTLSGNPLAVAAGLATLELLDEAAYARLAATTERLAAGLREAAGDYPVQVVCGAGPADGVLQRAGAVTDFADAQACDLDAYARWCRELLSRGVYPPPSQFEAWFPSLAHTAEQIDRTLEAAAAAFARAARERRSARVSSRAVSERALTTRRRARRALRALLRDEGGLIATLVDGSLGADDAGERRAPAAKARRSWPPRGRARRAAREEYELLVEAIYEGYLLHYGAPRVVRAPEADLRVLAGDRLYAIGLARLVELGDTLAVAELADTITLSALAQGAGDAALADAVWAAGARAVGWGSSEQHSARQGARGRRRRPRRSRRCAQARCAPAGARPESRLDIVRGRCPTSTQSTSPSTPPTA